MHQACGLHGVAWFVGRRIVSSQLSVADYCLEYWNSFAIQSRASFRRSAYELALRPQTWILLKLSIVCHHAFGCKSVRAWQPFVGLVRGVRQAVDQMLIINIKLILLISVIRIVDINNAICIDINNWWPILLLFGIFKFFEPEPVNRSRWFWHDCRASF